MAKKIINGRMYNTDTTEVLGSWDNGYPRGDLFMLLVAHSQILVTVMEDMIALVKNLSRCLWNRLSNGRKNI